MLTEIEGDVLTSMAAAGPAALVSRMPKPIRVSLLTKAPLGDDLRERLLDRGFAVQVFGAESLHGLSVIDIDADIIVIDPSLPGSEGIKAMAQLRFPGINAPAVLLNGPLALMKRADYGSDVVHGSRHVEEFANALKLAAGFAVSRKACPTEQPLACGNLVLHAGRAFWNGVDLDLTVGEYKIIDLLASLPGEHFTYRAIYDRLRHKGFVAGEGPRGYCSNVRSAIKRLRNKFRAVDPSFKEIETYVGFGYRWRKPERSSPVQCTGPLKREGPDLWEGLP
jgi:two-component system response regulator ChvI